MILAVQAPICRIIARPNGAWGKTTFALKYLPRVTPGTAFVNADLIAAGLSPPAPEQQLFTASRLLLQRLRSSGWRVELFYLALPNVELSQQRVAERVAHGGHSIAPDDILRRFPRSLRNLLDVYAGAAGDAFCLLNSGPSPEFVFVQQGETKTVLSQPVYEDLVKAAMS
jgi:predicted ABC-type ATPase